MWAYTANDGSEYAIMGNVEGIAIVAVPSLEVVAQIDGPTEDAPFYWRDIKTYGSFAYVSTEAYGRSEGLQVIDLRGLPHHAREVAVVRGQDDRLVSSHNLSIDTATGYAYMLNSDGNEIVVIDLADPHPPRRRRLRSGPGLPRRPSRATTRCTSPRAGTPRSRCGT